MQPTTYITATTGCRMAYSKVGVVREWWPSVPVAGVTATATEDTISQICTTLRLVNVRLLKSPVMRSNLHLSVQKISMSGVEKYQPLLRKTLAHMQEGGLLVFCQRKAECKKVYEVLLSAANGAVAMFHSDLSDAEKTWAAAEFTKGAVKVLICTVAFGLGVDVPNVRCVIHWGPPSSMEQYAQEVGRAGRNGMRAVCHMFHGGEVYEGISSKIEWNHRGRKSMLQKASAMATYCGLAWTCRHAFICRSFGEADAVACGQCCDVCTCAK